jgi:pimeloyl-ACP methyl ester carboxylesterase
MPAQVAIVHGWSDTSTSFHDLRDYLVANGYQVAQIWLGDYVSMDDDVRVEDVAKRMEAVIRAAIGDGSLASPFDLIVHSTGGLVAREWAVRFYPDGGGCPAKRIVMLAPANFGSALAAMGKSMIGRLAKGWNHWFQTGAEMLNGLELASPYQWNLACRDLLDPSPEGNGTGPYGADKVWPFVIIGSRGYTSQLRQIVNENGSDGTVRAAAANLNAVGMTVDFSRNSDAPDIRVWGRRSGKFAIPFAVLPDRDHGTIIVPAERTDAQPQFSDRLGHLILQALGCDSAATYAQIYDSWNAISDQTADLARSVEALAAAFPEGAPEPQAFHQYFHVISRVRDDNGQPVDDYFLEFFSPLHEGDKEAIYFHKQVLEDVHVNGRAPSFRALFVDRNDLLENYYRMIGNPQEREVAVSISAAQIGENVRYFDSTMIGASGHLVVHREDHEARRDLPARLFRNTTHLVEIIIPRQSIDKVFKLSR